MMFLRLSMAGAPLLSLVDLAAYALEERRKSPGCSKEHDAILYFMSSKCHELPALQRVF